ncbi:MAG: hypothetical protein ACOCTG_04105, partial [Bacteroidota bacterium]
MQYAATISLARTLLGAGRPDDVARMIEPLAPAVVADPSEAVLHALLARVALLSHADPAEAEAHLRPAGSPISFEIPDVDLWQGWLNAWPYAETFRPVSARYHLERAHRLAVRDLDVGQQCWALLGGALLYLLLDEPLLSRHLLQQARRTGWLRHDREAVCWMYGIEAVLALRAGDYSAATDAVEQLRDPANDMAAELYRFRALALELRLAVSTGRDERSMADTVLDRIGDAARTYC